MILIILLICEACIAASNSVCSSQKNRSVIPGWNELVKEHRERAIFGHSIWKSCGSPKQGHLSDARWYIKWSFI